MTRTAYDEHYGVGVDVAISANYVLRLPFGENGARFYCLRPSVASLEVRLPVAGWARLWDSYVVANHGSHTLTIRDVIGTGIYTLPVGERVELTLIDTSTAWGTWLRRGSTSTIGTTLVHDRTPLQVVFGTWAGNGINLRTYCEQAFGYDGSKPASIYCQLHSGIVIGSETTAEPGFDTGLWPAGTTLLLELGAGTLILGRGGAGGRGGDVPPGLLAAAGSTGGTALRIQCDTNLVNYGEIAGGGGGGGGNVYLGAVPGGGGGGGAGYQASVGGASGLNAVGQPSAYGAGLPGLIGVPGTGGITTASTGGTGGYPGLAGGAGGTSGGAAGNAIERLSTATLTKLVAGAITGPEVVI